MITDIAFEARSHYLRPFRGSGRPRPLYKTTNFLHALRRILHTFWDFSWRIFRNLASTSFSYRVPRSLLGSSPMDFIVSRPLYRSETVPSTSPWHRPACFTLHRFKEPTSVPWNVLDLGLYITGSTNVMWRMWKIRLELMTLLKNLGCSDLRKS